MTVSWDWERFEFPSPELIRNDSEKQLLKTELVEESNPLKFLEPEVSEAEFLKGLIADRKKHLKKHVKAERQKSIKEIEYSKQQGQERIEDISRVTMHDASSNPIEGHKTVSPWTPCTFSTFNF